MSSEFNAGSVAEKGGQQSTAATPPTLLQFLPWGSHGGDLLGGEGLEGLSDEVRVRRHHLLPPGSLHHVRHVTVVDELNCL